MNVNWGKSLNVIGWWQVAEDYGDEERERLQEELSTVKRRFSHNKVKRKWVSDIYLIGENWYWFAVEYGIRGPHHPLYGKHSQSLVRTGLVSTNLVWFQLIGCGTVRFKLLFVKTEHYHIFFHTAAIRQKRCFR